MDGPVSTSEATEVRCEEKSRGGLKFEVILSEPVVATPPRKTTPSETDSPSVEDIQRKLQAAEERRASLEASRLANLQAHKSRVEEANRKKEEAESAFVEQTKAAIDSKMEKFDGKKEAMMNDLMSKLKDHDKHVENVRLNKERLSFHEGENETTASSG